MVTSDFLLHSYALTDTFIISPQTDARVQTISEGTILSPDSQTRIVSMPHSDCFYIAIGVIRMIKLFGWEDKVSKKVEEKREEELAWLWKVKVSLA